VAETRFFAGILFPTLIITIPATILTLICWQSVWFSANHGGLAVLAGLYLDVCQRGCLSGFFLAQPSINIYLHAPILWWVTSTW